MNYDFSSSLARAMNQPRSEVFTESAIYKEFVDLLANFQVGETYFMSAEYLSTLLAAQNFLAVELPKDLEIQLIIFIRPVSHRILSSYYYWWKDEFAEFHGRKIQMAKALERYKNELVVGSILNKYLESRNIRSVSVYPYVNEAPIAQFVTDYFETSVSREDIPRLNSAHKAEANLHSWVPRVLRRIQYFLEGNLFIIHYLYLKKEFWAIYFSQLRLVKYVKCHFLLAFIKTIIPQPYIQRNPSLPQ